MYVYDKIVPPAGVSVDPFVRVPVRTYSVVPLVHRVPLCEHFQRVPSV